MLPWQRHIVSLTIEKPKFVFNLLAAIFGDRRIKGFREKGKYLKYRYQKLYVFSHLNTNQYRACYNRTLEGRSFRQVCAVKNEVAVFQRFG